MSMITAASWVPRGCAAEFPNKYDFNEEEFERISGLAKLQLDDANEELEEAQAKKSKKTRNAVAAVQTNGEADDDLREYDLENYDESDKESDVENGNYEAMHNPEESSIGNSGGMFGSIKNLVYHASNDEDPYITLKDDEGNDSEREELQILPSDSLILTAKVEDEVAHLEVYVYEDEEDNLYVHHDLMLPAIPLAVEHIHWRRDPQDALSQAMRARATNLVAVGTMDPEIELWDLDTVDTVYPYAILGEAPTSSTAARKKKKKKTKKIHPDHHTDAVLALASNPTHRNLLASASADTTVKLWDLNTATPSGTHSASSYTYHTDKVCSLAWHPSESTALLSGSYDRTAIAADMRVADKSSSNGSSRASADSDTSRRKWTVESDVESVKWSPHNAHTFFVATEAGMLHCFDARAAPSGSSVSKPLWTLAAHDAPLSAFDVNPHVPGYMATGSADRTVKLWRMPTGAASEAGAEAGPSLITTKQPEAGRVFSVAFAPDEEVAFRLAIAGSKGSLQVWDTSTNAAVRRAFASVGAAAAGDIGEAKEKMVRLELDDNDDDDDDEDEDDEQAGENGEDRDQQHSD